MLKLLFIFFLTFSFTSSLLFPSTVKFISPHSNTNVVIVPDYKFKPINYHWLGNSLCDNHFDAHIINPLFYNKSNRITTDNIYDVLNFLPHKNNTFLIGHSHGANTIINLLNFFATSNIKNEIKKCVLIAPHDKFITHPLKKPSHTQLLFIAGSNDTVSSYNDILNIKNKYNDNKNTLVLHPYSSHSSWIMNEQNIFTDTHKQTLVDIIHFFSK